MRTIPARRTEVPGAAEVPPERQSRPLRRRSKPRPLRHSALSFAAVVLALLSPLRAQTRGSAAETGLVSGAIFDAQTGKPVPEATVSVIELAGRQTRTDVDGWYELELPPGTYTLQVQADGYVGASLERIQVTAGQTTDGSTVLAASDAVTTIEVTAESEPDETTAESLLAERRVAAAVVDGISAEEISKMPASDAAEAVARVTGVSVLGNGHVFVRGLGERYSATMLNNTSIATTEPEKRVVPLDLFQSRLIDTVRIVKTYRADLPGEFSGGMVQLETVRFPHAGILEVGANAAFNTQTTGRRFHTYPGGALDFFGFGSGARSLPEGIPTEARLFRGAFSDEELAAFGRLLPVNWEPTPVSSARPEQSYNVVAGNTFGKLGLVGSVTFTNGLQAYPEIFRAYRLAGPGRQQLFVDYDDFRADTESAHLSTLLNASYKFSPRHSISIHNTLTNDGEKEARRFSGFDGNTDEPVADERLRWIQRRLWATQIEGTHTGGPLNSLFTWRMGISDAARQEPDLREVRRIVRPNGDIDFLADPDSGTRYFGNLDERVYEPSAAWKLPFYKGSVAGNLDLGFRGTFRDRSFVSRRFRFTPGPRSRVDLSLPSNELFAVENIRPDGIQFREITRGTDAYTADMTIYAGFASLDLALGQRWRINAGLRIEDAEENVITLDPLNAAARPVVSTLVNRDPLPALNVTCSLTPNQIVRLGWGRTVARPDFRELTPFDFTEIVGGLSTAGNPDLRRTSIQNFDVRWEWFPGGGELLAAGFFYKDFTDPIELILEPGANQRRTWVNAAGARNFGVEVEFRRNLRFVHGALREFFFNGNFAVVDSAIEIGDETKTSVTNRKRPLIGQSRYVVNVALEWARPQWRSSARLYGNYFSRRIAEVGSFGLDDTYEEGRTGLAFAYDFSLRENGRWRLQFTVENLTNADYLWTQGGEIRRLYRPGRTFQVGMTLDLVH